MGISFGLFPQIPSDLNIDSFKLLFMCDKLLHTHVLKACVCYFLTNVYFSLIDSTSKTMKDVIYFI